MEGQQTPPRAPLTNEQDVQENKIWAILAYLGILCLVPLLAKKDSKFAQFHAKQGLILFIASFIGAIPVVGWLLAPLLMLILFIISLVGIIKVLQGQYWKIPVIGNYAEKINI